MKSRQRILFYAIFPFCLLFLLPACLDIFFPIALLLILKIACLAIAPLFMVLLLKKQSSHTISIPSGNKPLPFFWWLIIMGMIILFVSMLFLGQLCTINQYMIQNKQMPITLLLPWLERTFNFVFLNPILFPWSLLGFALVVLFHLNNNYSGSLFSDRHSNHLLSKVWHRAFDISISSALLALLFSSVAFCIIQIGVFLSPNLNIFTHPFFNMLFCSSLFFLTSTHRAKKIMQFFAKKHFSISSIQGLSIIVYSILGMLIAGLILKYSPGILEQVDWHPTQFITPHYFLLSLEIWSTAWWLVLTPFLASFIIRISAGRSIFTTLAFLLIIPIFVFHWAPHIMPFLIKIFFLPTAMLSIQLISVLFLLALFTGKATHLVLRLGYFPAIPLKKERSLDIQQLILLPLCILGLIGFLGVIGLQFYYGILGFNLLISLISVSFKQKKTP